MTYQEAENLINEWLPKFRSQPYFHYNNINSLFMGLIIAPEDSTIESKQSIFEKCFHEGVDNKSLLLEMGVWDKEKKVFLIYRQGGYDIIIPFENYLQQLNTTS